ncbi:MAG: DUF99 family protein [Candidatus Bathyarchaeia archaeon]
MRLHIHKRAFRALGVSESFIKGLSEKSILAGVVLRSDRIIDGFTFSRATVGGMDATDSIINMYRALGRDDINILMLNGCVISWYNVVDLQRVHEETGLPLICVTYEESPGLEKYFMELFPEDYEKRVEIYRKNGLRTQVRLHTGFDVYIRFYGMKLEEAKGILDKFTLHGAVPEPLRIARLLARGIMRTLHQ